MTPQGTAFRYDAFISYRHKELDRRWAQWLLEALETYKVPRTLVKQGFAPPHPAGLSRRGRAPHLRRPRREHPLGARGLDLPHRHLFQRHATESVGQPRGADIPRLGAA